MPMWFALIGTSIDISLLAEVFTAAWGQTSLAWNCESRIPEYSIPEGHTLVYTSGIRSIEHFPMVLSATD
jgi:hypothetical protein